ncbi:cytokine receptor-like factor 2 isoform X2 [Macaca fascicularis]|uniref:cytokine receptor-like factor 2 isoform X2 n=1 Tax=Macaca fascicularis TaxID=9541 RepID=UPI003D15D46A
MGRLVLLWGAAVFLLGSWMALGQVATGEGLQIQIMYFNLETVQVTWNASHYPRSNLSFHYKFSRDEAYDQCTVYILQEGHTSGCLLDAEQQDDILYFSIRNGTHPVFTASRWIFYYLKPSSPKQVSFSWHQDAVTVTCSDLSYRGLLYEVQYRSPFDTEWQSKQENTCNVTIEDLDAEKCYAFRARVKAMEDAYGPDTYPSDWSEVTCWQRGKTRDSCPEPRTPPKPKLSKFMLVSSLAILLMVCLLLLSLRKLWRVKKFLMPSVPDPKSTFPGLFEIHQGNFQVPKKLVGVTDNCVRGKGLWLALLHLSIEASVGVFKAVSGGLHGRLSVGGVGQRGPPLWSCLSVAEGHTFLCCFC